MSLEYLSFFVGAGFPDESLVAAKKLPLDFIGADAGSIDVGPYQLAGDGTIFSEPLCRYDLRRSLVAARSLGIPLVIGSCGGSGRDWGVDWFAQLVREIAAEEKLPPFNIAKIYSEIDRDYLCAKIRDRKVRPLSGLQFDYTEEHVRRSTRVTGVMGIEPFNDALAHGADVVLAGRATDSAIFAAIPVARGYPAAISWHAAKVAECGGAIGDPARNDLLRVRLDREGFIVSPMSTSARCTPWSVSAHQLYENGDPIVFTEPGGVLETSRVVYAPHDEHSVRISGGTWTTSETYTVKLEGVEPAGYQSISLASYNDRVLLEELPTWLQRTRAEIDTKIKRVFGKKGSDIKLTIRTYGAGNGSDLFNLKPVTIPRDDAFFVVDAIAPTQELANSACTIAWHTLIHFPPTGWKGSFVTAAWPFNPPVMNRGIIHRFNVNHVIEVDHPLEVFRTQYEEVG